MGPEAPYERRGAPPVHRRGRSADRGLGSRHTRQAQRPEVPLTPAERFNLATALVDEHIAAGRGGRTALRWDGGSITYEDLGRAVARAGNALRDLEIEPEQRVGLLLPDSLDFVAAFLGAVKIGAVPVTLSTLLTSRDYGALLADCRASALIVHAELLRAIEPIRSDLRTLRHVLVAGSAPPGAVSLRAVVERASDQLEPEPTTRDDMCFWQYSSGTTGEPKAVVHLHGNAITPADLHGEYIARISADDRVFSVAKLFFSYGLNNSLVIPLRRGATAILMAARPEPARVLETIARERPSVFYAVPTAYAALLAAAEAAAPADLSSVRACISAGEALPAPVFERWRRRFGLEILDGIGSTEIGYIAISNFPGRARPGTSGQVIPGYEAKVVDADGGQLAAGDVGDLLVRGPSTAQGYWRRRDATKRTFRGEWVFTGDRYSVDGDGYFRYHGRSDDLLKVGGIWVSPLEVETVLLEHSAVLECAVVGRADAEGLIKPSAYVVLKEGASAPAVAEELRAFARDRLAPYKYPRWIEFVPELPKTSTGKIQRFRLRE